MPNVIVYRENLLPPSETFILQQVRLMDRWRATLFGLARPAKGLALEGVRHHIVTLGGLELAKLHPKLRRLAARSGLIEAVAVRQARALKPELIHAHFGVDAVAAHRLACKLDVPLLVTLHGYDVSVRPEFWRQGDMGAEQTRYPEQLRALCADPRVSFTAVSQALKHIAVEQFGLPAERIEVMHLGIDVDRFPPSLIPLEKRPPKVLFVGRMVEKKAPQVLLQALAQVRSAGVPCEATFIGDGPLLADMRQLSEALGVGAKFLGVQDSEVIARELENSRVFCLPSVRAGNGDSEGMGIVLLEAQSRGVPVITSAVGGREEGISPGETGFAFPEGDVDALADAIQRLLTDEALWASMSARGPGFIRAQHDAHAWTRRLQAHYSDLVKRSTRSRS